MALLTSLCVHLRTLAPFLAGACLLVPAASAQATKLSAPFTGGIEVMGDVQPDMQITPDGANGHVLAAVAGDQLAQPAQLIENDGGDPVMGDIPPCRWLGTPCRPKAGNGGPRGLVR